jgi:hypothetical protein
VGGINPEKPLKVEGGTDANRTVQEHTRALFEVAERFFAAQAALERAVIAESAGVYQSADLDAATTSMHGVVHTARRALSGPTTLATVSAGLDTWHAAYAATQQPLLERLHVLAEELVRQLESDPMADALTSGNLQVSLWHDGPNSAFRERSLEFLSTLLDLLRHHSSPGSRQANRTMSSASACQAACATTTARHGSWSRSRCGTPAPACPRTCSKRSPRLVGRTALRAEPAHQWCYLHVHDDGWHCRAPPESQQVPPSGHTW